MDAGAGPPELEGSQIRVIHGYGSCAALTTAYYCPVLLSERASYMKKKESNCQTKKTENWPTDRRSHYNLNWN
jgi:hypothetical protein